MSRQCVVITAMTTEALCPMIERAEFLLSGDDLSEPVRRISGAPGRYVIVIPIPEDTAERRRECHIVCIGINCSNLCDSKADTLTA